MYIFVENDHPWGNSKIEGVLKKKNTPGGKVPGRIFRKAHANARTFPIFIQFLCNNTKNSNQHNNNSKRLTIAVRYSADFSVFPPGAGVFFAKKDPPGVNSKVGGESKKKKIPPG